MAGGGMHLLEGYAGTGKTFLLAEIIDYLEQNTQHRALITAPTHKAVKVLRHFVPGVDAMTTHAALALTEYIDGHGNQTFKRQGNKPVPAIEYQFVVVDEASMLADDLFMELVPFVEMGIKVLFVGDPMQIPPVNQKDSMPMNKDVRKDYNISVVSLKEIIRQEEGNPIIETSFKIRKAILRPSPIVIRENGLTLQGEVRFVRRADESLLIEEILPLYASEEFSKDPDTIKVIAWTNKTVNRFNDIIRAHLFGENLPKVIEGDKLIADAPVMEDKRILIHTNEEMDVVEVNINEMSLGSTWIMKYYHCRVRLQRTSGIYNEVMIRIVHEESEDLYDTIIGKLRVLAKSHKQGGYEARSAWMDYFGFIEEWHRVKYNYAITAHKSQGSTYKQVVVLEYDMEHNRKTFEKNRILYTACTRPSHCLIVVYNPLT